MLKKYIPELLSVIIACIVIATLNYTSYCWCDEQILTDIAIDLKKAIFCCQKPLTGVYNPFYLILLTGWISCFGVSHFIVTGFGVVIALVLSLLMLREIRLRGLNWTCQVLVVFVLLYWGGWQYLTVVTLARPDILAYLFAFLTAAEICPKENLDKVHGWKIFWYSFFTMLTAFCPIPVLVVFGCLLLLTRGNLIDRKILFKRGCVAVAGIAAAFGVACFFWVCNMQLIRFVHMYFSFGSATIKIPFFEKLKAGYLMDMTALVIMILSLILIAVVKKVRSAVRIDLAIFVLSIPLIMTLAGRYPRYYTGLFYLPVILLFCYIIAATKNKLLTLTALLGAIGLVGGRPVYMHDIWCEHIRHADATEQFVAKHTDLLKGSNLVYCTDNTDDASMYYPLMRRGIKMMSMSEQAFGEVGQYEKLVSGLRKIFKDKRDVDKAVEYVKKVQTFPDSGKFNKDVKWLIGHRKREAEWLCRHLPDYGYSMKLIDSNDTCYLYEIEEVKK